MYATCTFCHRSLGRNESLEMFPVGQRIVYDAAKGRLWVVCPRCMQWNLSPLEQRWEAIESAERLFRSSKLRRSTDNIGLARLSDGTDLVRVGKPLRPEFAAWRYGQRFVRRRQGAVGGAGVGVLVLAAGATLIPGGGLVAGMLAGIGASSVAALLMQANGGKAAFAHCILTDNDDQYVRLTANEVSGVRVIAEGNSWALRMPYHSRSARANSKWTDLLNFPSFGNVTISGQQAVAAATQLLPLVNGFGAGKSVVSDAVNLASEWNNPSSGFAYSLANTHTWAAKRQFADPGVLRSLPAPVRLALEMSLHEDAEQRALEGELDELERSWKNAEEIAAIADSLFVPGAVSRAFSLLKWRNHPA